MVIVGSSLSVVVLLVALAAVGSSADLKQVAQTS
jgi:hypothetical protein